MAASSVDFKANANGLVVVFDRDEPFDSIFSQLSKKLESGGVFFQTRYLATTYRGRKLSAEEEGKISRMMSEKTGARTVIFEFDKEFVPHGGSVSVNNDGTSNGDVKAVIAKADGAANVSGNGAAGSGTGSSVSAGSGDTGYGGTGHGDTGYGGTTAGNTDLGGYGTFSVKLNSSEIRARDIASTLRRRYDAQDLNECMTKFCRGTLRSGKLVSYNGNVVIIGDINPGAEVEATGNIVVIGNVRGIVHAGAGGNKEASVIALHFAPTQLRIADIITNKVERKPTLGRALGMQSAEIAYIIGDEIVFEKLTTV